MIRQNPEQLPELSQAQFEDLWPDLEPLALELNPRLSKDDLPSLKDFLFQLMNRSLKQSHLDYETAQQLLWCADRDTGAYRILHSGREYAAYAFHLQQAVEKVTKAHGIYIKVIKSRQLREIGHQPLRHMGRRFDNYLSRLPPTMINPNRKEAKRLLGNFRRFTPTDDAETARLSFDGVCSLFSRVDEITQLVRDNAAAIDLVNRLSNHLANYGIKMNMNALQQIETHTSLTATLYILMLLTYPHEQFARYPDREVKPWEYTAELGIVKAFDLVDARLSAAVSAVRLCFDVKPSEVVRGDKDRETS